jgi:hypothetical protein
LDDDAQIRRVCNVHPLGIITQVMRTFLVNIQWFSTLRCILKLK